jgi:S1-C subfamily serine protease
MSKIATVNLEKMASDFSVKDASRVEAAAVLLEFDDARMDRRLRALTTVGWWLVLTALVLFTTCCVHRGTRTIPETHEASVRINVTCFDASGALLQGHGSGVVVGEHRILTARHVASEAGAAAGCIYTVTTSEGLTVLAMPRRDWPDRDVAELITLDPLPYTPIKLADAPGAGEVACIVSAYPRFYRRCGAINYYRDDAPGDVAIDALVEPGNSGSGVYDNRGRLVGITTHLYRCQNGQWCGGKFSSLDFLGGVL